MYNDTVLDHFSNPRNAGELPGANGTGKAGNPSDGDNIIIYIKVQNNIMEDISFKTYGCGAAIAASSMVTVMAMGRSLASAQEITNEMVAEALGGLPPQKLLCSNIAATALHRAIEDYMEKSQS